MFGDDFLYENGKESYIYSAISVTQVKLIEIPRAEYKAMPKDIVEALV